MKNQRTWLIGGAAVLGVLLFSSRARALLIPGSSDKRDLDALASMLITETSFLHGKEEMAQIVFVAVNRAKRWDVPIYKVVAGPRPEPGTNPWNDSATYKALFARAPNNPRWPAAREFVQDVLAGSYRNLGASSFIHPGGMPVPPCASNRVATSTMAGTRCIPTWAVGGKTVGRGLFA